MLTGNPANCQTPSTINGASLQRQSCDSTYANNRTQQIHVNNSDYLLLDQQPPYEKAKRNIQYSQQHQRQHYVDIITQSPQEILCLIINFLPMDTRVQCIKVCPAWRKTLLQCPEAWKVIKGDDEAYKLLPLVSHHIEILTIRNEKVAVCFRHMDDFAHLQSLLLSIEENHQAFTTIDTNDIYQALKSVSGTLTRLKLEWAEATFSFGRILSICKRLTMIQLIVWEVTDYEKNEYIVGSNATFLTSISLEPNINNFENRINVSKIQPLLRLLPHLQYLRLECSASDDDISSAINTSDHPYLTTLITDMCNFEITYKIPDDMLPAPQDTINKQRPTIDHENQLVISSTISNNGLKCLILHSMHSTTEIQTLFEQSKDSLRTLCLAPRNNKKKDSIQPMAIENNNWHRISSFTLSQLVYFQIETWLNATTEFLSTHLPTMLLHMPALETLVLGNISTGDANLTVLDNIYSSITQLTRLQSLRFVEYNVFGQGILHFLEHPPPRLQQLMMYGCIGVTFPVLERMAKMQQLKSLIQLGLDIDVTIAEYTQFLELIGHHTNLSYLEIGVGRVSECRLQSIIQCKTLSTLVLRRVFGLTDKMVTELRSSIQHVVVVSEWEDPPFPVPPLC
ncbi:hypothetical protein BDA99DRAFT_530116 [Phascolomyces articulosus]|uniref:F-box domain-containing protein n=1 Tax=Phascolomyces articulosus TaxID=60185 RepID=A0AAD5JWZ4_9FUNG|nr:hypothetical protein BDA99DRAFT_530116 [Phascolomyces articulosus]